MDPSSNDSDAMEVADDGDDDDYEDMSTSSTGESFYSDFDLENEGEDSSSSELSDDPRMFGPMDDFMRKLLRANKGSFDIPSDSEDDDESVNSDDSLMDDHYLDRTVFNGRWRDNGEEEEDDCQEEEFNVADEELQEDLERLRALQTLQRRQKNLEALSMMAVVEQATFFSPSLKPFACLSETLAETLASQLKDAAVMSSVSTPLLIHSACRHLTINLADNEEGRLGWTKQSVTRCFKEISTKSELQSLELQFLSRDWRSPHHAKDMRTLPLPSKQQLHEALASLTKLRNLDIYYIHLTDEALKIVGSTCHLLKRLVVAGAKRVTDVGVEYLCSRPAPLGRCVRLEQLDVRHTGVSGKGVFLTLLHLTELREIRHPALEAAVFAYYLHQKANQRPYQLKLQLYITMKKSGPLKDLNLLSQILPQLASIVFKRKDMENLSALRSLQHLKEIYCRSLRVDTRRYITLVPEHLTKLQIREERKFLVDVSLIGFMCPNLEDIHFRFWADKPGYFLERNRHFNKLVKAYVARDMLFNFFFPENVLACILAAPRLRELVLRKVMQFSSVCLQLLLEARNGDLPLFQELRYLQLYHVSVRPGLFKRLVCNLPAIKRILLMHDQGHAATVRFVELNFPGVSISQGSSGVAIDF